MSRKMGAMHLRLQTNQVVEHPHQSLKLVLSQPALLHGSKGAAGPSDRANVMGPVLLSLQDYQILCSAGTGQG